MYKHWPRRPLETYHLLSIMGPMTWDVNNTLPRVKSENLDPFTISVIKNDN